MKRAGMMLLGLALTGGGMAVVAQLWPDKPVPSVEAARASADSETRLVATIYRSPTCACCHEYETYLEAQGYAVRAVEVEDTAAMKREHGVPPALWSCHTGVIGGYIVEGHVPVEAIEQLLANKPAVNGISLPGMPPGSPGMGGTKSAPFEVVSFSGDEIAAFVTL